MKNIFKLFSVALLSAICLKAYAVDCIVSNTTATSETFSDGTVLYSIDSDGRANSSTKFGDNKDIIVDGSKVKGAAIVDKRFVVQFPVAVSAIEIYGYNSSSGRTLNAVKTSATMEKSSYTDITSSSNKNSATSTPNYAYKFTASWADPIAASTYIWFEFNNSCNFYKISYTPAGPVGPVAVTGVELNKTTLTLEAGQNETLTATVLPSGATNKNITWSSDKENIATVDQNGKVSALSPGEAKITVTTEDGNKTATCTVTVNAPAAPIEVESISIKSATTISIGSSETLSVTYTPENANTGKAITWTSDNPNIAKVDNTGKVTGVAAGTATITATSEKGKTATCAVTVKAVAVTGISISPATATVKIGSTITLTADVTPTDATNKNVTWSSSDENIATVINGKVTGVAEGTVTITATSAEDNTKKGECVVTVQEGTPLPDVGLVAHTPEIYEDPAGYNTPLVTYKDREYEVYYTSKGKIGGSGSSYALVYTTVGGKEISNATKAKDGWFEHNSGSSEDSGGSAVEEFKQGGRWKMKDNQFLQMQVKGFDRFRLFCADKNESSTNKQYFEVYVDDVLTPIPFSKSATVREVQISTDEHVIKVVALGSSQMDLYGWSLRVTDDPIVRYLNGPKEQSVYQTKVIQQVAYRIRRATSYRITWVGGKTIDGVTLRAGANDSVYLEGTANAAAGTYIYKVEALDKDGIVKSSEQGSIKIETHIFDAQKGNSFTTNIAEPIKPLNFLYYASNNNDIQLNCDIQGLSLTYDRDSIAVLTGTPALGTTEGEHPYSITAVGGNTVTGTITIVVPDPYFEPIAEAKGKDGQPLSFSLIARHASEVAVTGLPAGFTVNYDATTDIVTIAGTPNVGTPYPKSFEFTATAQPRYAGKTATSVTGKLTILDPNAQCILVVCKDLKEVSEDPIAKYLASKQYDITLREQTALAGSGYDAFNLIVISENADADHEEVLKIIRGGENSPAVNVPVFNLKGFTYATGRLGWGRPNNGSIDTLNQGATKIYVQREEHRIFKNLNKDYGDSLTILQYEKGKQGVMPIEIRMDDYSYCLSTAHTRDIDDYYKDGDLQAIMHEMPAELRGGKKYICLPLARTAKLTTDGERLVNAIVKYLIEDEQETLAEPELQITRFAINGIDGDIDEFSKTITVYIDTLDYPGLDFKALETEIDLKDPIYTYVKPEDGSLVNYQFATSTPVKFVVSDYIRLVTYNVKIRLREPQGIEDIYEVGQWVNIYDIYGRQLTTTNENIYTMDLPRGIYLVVTENGQTIKIMR